MESSRLLSGETKRWDGREPSRGQRARDLAKRCNSATSEWPVFILNGSALASHDESANVIRTRLKLDQSPVCAPVGNSRVCYESDRFAAEIGNCRGGHWNRETDSRRLEISLFEGPDSVEETRPLIRRQRKVCVTFLGRKAILDEYIISNRSA